MRSGVYKYSRTELAIGSDGDGGIALIRTLNGDWDHAQVFGRFFTHNWDIRLSQQRIQVAEANTPGEYDYQVAVSYGGLGTSFRATYAASSTFREISANELARLTYTGNRNNGAIYTFRASDGTTVVFRPISTTFGLDCTQADSKCVYPSTITKPDGTVYNFEYDSVSSGELTRLRAVVSNRGYALLFEYYPPNSGYNLVSKSCVLNIAITAKPLSNVCPAGAMSSNYTYSGIYLATATDGSGATETIASSNSSLAITKPGMSQPFVTNAIGISSDGNPVVASQSFLDGQSYSYLWDPAPPETGGTGIAGGRFTNALGGQVTVRYGQYLTPNSVDPTYMLTPGPETVIDELGRTTTSNYCVPHPFAPGCIVNPLQSRMGPEGDRTEFSYDTARNVIQIRKVAKPSSGLATLVESRTYDCASIVVCAKPNSITDPKGNATNYTYDPAHGGLLTSMQPAPSAGAARPLGLTTWAQRYAWIKNSSGVLVQAATPVWLIATETQCQTVAGSNSPVCDGAAQQTLTTYVYGATGTGQSLLLKGKAVTSAGVTLRTCFGYDSLARKISETQPNANLGVCP